MSYSFLPLTHYEMAYYSQANHKAKNYNTVSHSPICRVDYIKSSIRLQQQKIFGEHLFHFLRNLCFLSRPAVYAEKPNSGSFTIRSKVINSGFNTNFNQRHKAKATQVSRAWVVSHRFVWVFFFSSFFISSFKPSAFSQSSAPQKHEPAPQTKTLKVLPPTFQQHFPSLLLCQRKQKSQEQISCADKDYNYWIPLYT